MSAYRGPGNQPHRLWALWHEESHLYVQEHPVVPSDPAQPYTHVGERIPVSEHGLGIPEWRIDFHDVIASNLGIRWSL